MSDFESTKLGVLRTLIALTRKVRTLFDARTGEYGLTEARARLLLHLSKSGPLTQSELAEAMEVERPTMARLIDGMETSGMVRRDIHPGDRRQRHIHLTDAAEGQVQAVLKLSEQVRADVLAGISEEDLAITHKVLLQMFDNVVKAGH
ncbi:MarR family winged helix-turn-helix transcriptional regulator [Tropicimonas isoalkanivorans]|uniref:Transcriptional regulator, MarR family n=1 Tax=Tropicimonas isoalkanivorans TaxID=441112 RepID=A0A1I1E5V9_9RHOB|nr:MarR family transcriptional regulator [Tropicimonas isoalkanivorans]SFB82615.1 transcriptional regulator, MarR family [Tropicimonas isoalkanivorans]